MRAADTIDGYIRLFPENVQQILQMLRSAIRETAPGSVEAINYGIPTFKLGGNLVHFAAYRKHIGFYPTPSAIAAFKDELSEFRRSRGAVRFPIDKPIPVDIIKKIVQFRVNEETHKRNIELY